MAKTYRLISLILLAAGFVFRGKIVAAMTKAYMSPKQGFAHYTPPPAPNYSDDSAWAALPQTKDGADFIAPGLNAPDELSDIAVFFVHPTTYYAKAGWNAPIDEEDSRGKIDNLVMPAPLIIAAIFTRPA